MLALGLSIFYIQLKETEKGLELIQEALLIAEALAKKDPENFKSAVSLKVRLKPHLKREYSA